MQDAPLTPHTRVNVSRPDNYRRVPPAGVSCRMYLLFISFVRVRDFLRRNVTSARNLLMRRPRRTAGRDGRTDGCNVCFCGMIREGAECR